ncbi:hypothetical protein COT72_03050 [archaeon CG10_big_fil_rev_8_21_14_0_10_43_11]|nr:MAG: hypothetical protein COT72_03050 [archaeon CG10_big_fil_rev_8_21_14_0_10_43_11]
MQKQTETHLKNILKTLAEAKKAGEDFLWIRELSRRCNLNPATVTWCIHRYLWEKIEFIDVDSLLSKGLKIQPVSLREHVYQEILKNQKTT